MKSSRDLTLVLGYALRQANIVSPDGTRLAVAHTSWTLALRNLTDNTDKVILKNFDRSIHLPTFSPDGSKFASVVAYTVLDVWDTSTGNLLGEYQKHGMKITALAFSLDGTRIIFVHGHSLATTVKMWNVGEEFVTSFDSCAAAQSVAFLPDGTRFITMSKSCSVQIWDMTSNVPSSKFSAVERTVSQRNQFVISPNGTRSILGSHLWDIVNGQQLVSLPIGVSATKFSPDGAHIAYITRTYTFNFWDWRLHILDATTGAELYKSNRFGDLLCLSFTPDSTRLLCLAEHGAIYTLCLPSSVDTEVLSCIYRPDRLMIQELSPTRFSGWYRQANGKRIIWLPDDVGPVWLATAAEPFASPRLVYGQYVNEVTILDMDDYPEVLPGGVVWRKGGIRYVQSTEAGLAGTLASESGLPVWSSLLFNSSPC